MTTYQEQQTNDFHRLCEKHTAHDKRQTTRTAFWIVIKINIGKTFLSTWYLGFCVRIRTCKQLNGECT